ncbi:metallophosphoesterase [Anaerosalibacter massiliensis]|uniref:Metallophosphoesterase family protein n=1 Tax=Anaerosalibacter massiliensis TaxID=1347392 RepID=A0A9X2MNA7_9FIRM|nr:metallophosphoesterase [Anaerosalibacter massiliensis]MCR2044181.1 metallophosphoesterase family protein [Anaerosalibacter massiliensis]
MQNIYLISDTHFGQRFAVKFFRRPFKNIKEMHKALIKNWNDNIDENDIVLILGDFYGGNKIFSHFLLRKLNGEKILVKGNHDFKFRLKRLIETKKIKIYNKIEFFLDDYHFVLTHKPIKNIHEHTINIHGHHHRVLLPSKFEQNKYFNVAVDHNDYKPISIKKIVEDKLGASNINLVDIIEQIKCPNANVQYAFA